MIDERKILKKIIKYEYISFDIFDTLVKRLVGTYHEVWKLVQSEYNKNCSKKIYDFEEKRKNADAIAQEKYYEPTLDEIYSQLEYEENVRNDLKKIEEQIEIECSVFNHSFEKIIKNLYREKKKIIITTDMYLDRKVIEKILKKNNISYYRLYISSEIKKRKRDGSIFDYIKSDLNIFSNQICHIGDSKKSDFIMPKLSGIRSFLVPRNIILKKYNSKEENIMLRNFINNNLSVYSNDFFNIGYEVLGPLLYFYCTALKKFAIENNVNNLYFLAREGWLLKKAFELISSNGEVHTEYFCASRHSLRVPLLEYCSSLDELKDTLKMRRITTISDFFKNVDLNIDNYSSLIKKYNFKYDTLITIENFEEFYSGIEFDIKKNSSNKRKNLIGYIKQFNFTKKIIVCDVGWVGTMQKSLSKIVNDNEIKTNIIGYYIGLNDLYKNNEVSENMYQFLFDDKTHYSDVRPFLNLFESFFLADHGTTVSYEKINNKFVPLFAKYEYSNDVSEKFKKIQSGALKFIEDFKQFKYNDLFNVTPSESFASFKKLGTNPTIIDVNLFGNLTYVETSENYMAKPQKIYKYIFNPKKFYIDFCNCSWKIGFLKKILKIKIDYLKLYNFLDRISRS